MGFIEIKKATQNNYTSTIRINKDLNIVEKIIDYGEYTEELFDREIFWLNKLVNTDIVPKLLGFDKNNFTIKMEWSGDVLSDYNKPNDVYEQLYNINIILLKNHCFYNDWKWGNFLIKNNKIKIIDFGWCPMIIEDYSCGEEIWTNLKEKPAGNYFKDVLFNSQK